MSNNFRVLNVTRGFTLKFKQALKAVDECACAWVDESRTQVRDVTLSEAISLRNEQARRQQPLELPEVHGLTYEPPVCERSQTFAANRRDLLMQARQFVQSQA
jgi:hypothetical protein